MSLNDVDEWLRLQVIPSRQELLTNEHSIIEAFRVPDRPGARTFFARCLADWLSAQGGLLLLYETDIWPSSGFPFLYQKFLAPDIKSPAESFIDEWPGFTFDREDELVLAGAIALSLYQYWGFVCVSKNPHWWVRMNHDDFLEAGGDVPELPWEHITKSWN